MKKNITKGICSAVVGVVLLGVSSFAAFAQTTTATSSRVAGRAGALAQRLENMVNRADQEIARRITALNALGARIGEMQKVSANDKSDLSSTIQSQISAMNALESKITADAESTSSLKNDIQSITGSYRIYALVIPQGAIEAAADRVMTVANAMTIIGNKIQARILALGSSVSASTTATFTDFNAKVADATAQAQAAVSAVSGLMPDQGNQTQMQANTSALKNARSKLQAAQQDLVAARKDAETIVKVLEAFRGTPSSTATSSE
jgi:hypothetical protein